MNTPGIDGKSFYIQLDRDWFRKGDILNSNSVRCQVIKVYRNTWWRRFLLKLGFRVRLMQVKVIPKPIKIVST